MPRSNELSVSELRRDLPTVLHRVLVLNETFLVVKHGQPFAILSPVTDEEVRERLKKKLNEGMHDLVDEDELQAVELQKT